MQSVAAVSSPPAPISQNIYDYMDLPVPYRLKNLFLHIVRRSIKRGFCFESHAKMIAHLGCSRAVFYRHMQALEDGQWIERFDHRGYVNVRPHPRLEALFRDRGQNVVAMEAEEPPLPEDPPYEPRDSRLSFEEELDAIDDITELLQNEAKSHYETAKSHFETHKIKRRTSTFQDLSKRDLSDLDRSSPYADRPTSSKSKTMSKARAVVQKMMAKRAKPRHEHTRTDQRQITKALSEIAGIVPDRELTNTAKRFLKACDAPAREIAGMLFWAAKHSHWGGIVTESPERMVTNADHQYVGARQCYAEFAYFLQTGNKLEQLELDLDCQQFEQQYRYG